MNNNLDLDKLPDEYLISYYQDLMFNLAKSSRQMQDLFIEGYYNLKDAAQNKIINKINLYAILGFTAIKLLSGINHSNDVYPYLLSLNIGAYNFIAEKYNIAKLVANKNILQKFIINNIPDEFLQIAADCEDDTKMERVLNCIDKAFCNIVLSEDTIIRIYNYKKIGKCKKITNLPNCNTENLNNALILLSRSVLEISSNKTELSLKEIALKNDIPSIILYYLSNPKFSTKAVDDLVMNLPSKDMTRYPTFMASYLSGLLPIEFITLIKQKVEKKLNRSIFTEKNGKFTDFGAFCACVYTDTQNIENLTKKDLIIYKKARNYLKHCKTELAFFYISHKKSFTNGKTQKNGIAALQNFASRGLSHEIIEPEKLTIENIYENKLQKE